MEDTLRDYRYHRYGRKRKVLILVLMEDTLREPRSPSSIGTYPSLNPCFNGRYSQRANKFVYVAVIHQS